MIDEERAQAIRKVLVDTLKEQGWHPYHGSIQNNRLVERFENGAEGNGETFQVEIKWPAERY